MTADPTERPIARFFAETFEPAAGQIYSGAGQSPAAILQMIHTADPARKPMLAAVYDGIHWKGSGANNYDLISAHNLYPGAMLQVGMQLPLRNLAALQQISDGSYDARIQQVARAYGALPQPIFLRIGYEFDGIWNDYDPDAYVAAFQRIVTIFRAEQVANVAFVWNSFTPTHNIEHRTIAGQLTIFDKFDWYPGDAYVDWWSFNVWGDDTTGDVDPSFDGSWFVQQAAAHNKPVLIGELTYRANIYSWPVWFAAFYESLRQSGVQAFQYINWNWPIYPDPGWKSWANALYTDNAELIALYNQEMQNAVYVHRDASYAQPVPLWVAATRNAAPAVSGTPWVSSASTGSAYSSNDEFAIADPEHYGYSVENAQYQYGNGWQPYWANVAGTTNVIIRLTVPARSSGYLDLEAYAYSDSSAQTRVAHTLTLGSRPLPASTPSTATKYRFSTSDTRAARMVLTIATDAPSHIRVRHIGLQTLASDALAAPNGLTGVTDSAAGVLLSWQPIADAAAYNLYRDNQLIGTALSATFTDAAALPGSSYSYAVSAWHAQRGEGYLSRRCAITLPTAPAN